MQVLKRDCDEKFDIEGVAGHEGGGARGLGDGGIYLVRKPFGPQLYMKTDEK